MYIKINLRYDSETKHSNSDIFKGHNSRMVHTLRIKIKHDLYFVPFKNDVHYINLYTSFNI